MTLVRFVHAADLHLDSPFRGLLSVEPEVAATLQGATFAAYEKTIDLCVAERVDALLIAGDVFDGADRSLRAQLRFVDGLRRLDAEGIRSFVCHGNHDPLDGWEARLDFPPTCHRFGADVAGVPVFPAEPQRATVYGVSYPTREVRENLVSRFPVGPLPGFSIGLVHANVGADTGHEPYAPCTLQDLEATGMDYWALGHVHTRQVLRPKTPTVVYPGNPQGRHPNETGERGVYLAEVEDTRDIKLTFRAVDVVRWGQVAVGIEGLETEQALVDAVHRRVAAALEAADGRDLLFRLSLTGRGELHGSVGRQGFVDDLRARMNETWVRMRPFAYCERAADGTASAFDRHSRRMADDFVGELLRLVDACQDDPDQLDEMLAELGALYASPRLSRYLRDAAPSRADLRELLTAAEGLCLDRLLDGDSP